MKEQSHLVDATLHRGYAVLVVRRTVFNPFERHDQAMMWIDLPVGAAATGLRTLGSVGGRPTWFAGDLMEAEAAAHKYAELTGIGGYYPKDPALLSWRAQGSLLLQVFPCAPNAPKSVEYTLLIPMDYTGGAYHLRLPAMGTPQLTAAVTARSANSSDALFVDGKALAQSSHVPLNTQDIVDVSLVPSRPPMWAGELAVAPMGPNRVLTRLQVTTAPKLSTVPPRAQVVVVLDASRSVEDRERDASRRAASAYLSHFADAAVEIVTFARTPKAHFGRFVGVADARRELAGMRILSANGSNVDDALVEAERLLTQRPGPSSSKRIVLMTDGLTRATLAPGRIRGAIGTSGAIVHIGIFHEGWAALNRDDEHPWYAAVRSTGGLVWRASAPNGAVDAREREVFEEWARPTRVDHVDLVASGVALGAGMEVPTHQLAEGESIEVFATMRRPMTSVRAEGELWARPVQCTITPSEPAAKRWSAMVFGSPMVDELTESEMMALATKGGAVSPVTSYLAIEPGVRPSTEGLERTSSGSFRSRAPRVRMGASMVSGRGPFFDKEAHLQAELQRALRSCGITAGVSATFESNRAEVADVRDVKLHGAADAIGVRCMKEAIWALDLPAGFRDEPWTLWSIDAQPVAPPKPPALPARP